MKMNFRKSILTVLILVIVGSAAFAQCYYENDIFVSPTSDKVVMTEFEKDSGRYSIFIGLGDNAYSFSVNVNDKCWPVTRCMTEVVDLVIDMFVEGESTYDIQQFMNKEVVHLYKLGVKEGFTAIPMIKVVTNTDDYILQGYIFTKESLDINLNR